MEAGLKTRLGSLTFTLEETAEICLMRQKLVHKYIELGLLTPAVPGSKGRGCWHRFSPQQLIALAVAAGLVRSKRGCSLEYVNEVIETFSNMSESVLEHWLAVRRDAYTEEAKAKFDKAAIFELADDVEVFGVVVEPDMETLRDVVGRVDRVEEAILKRLGKGETKVDREQAIKINQRK
jgi:hypothetical protein